MGISKLNRNISCFTVYEYWSARRRRLGTRGARKCKSPFMYSRTPRPKQSLDKRRQNSRTIFTTPRVVNTPAKRIWEEQGWNLGKRGKKKENVCWTTREGTTVFWKTEKWNSWRTGKRMCISERFLREMEDGSLIAWKGDGGDLSEILPDWFMKISVKFFIWTLSFAEEREVRSAN